MPKSRFALSLLAGGALLAFAGTGWSMPNFARRYDMECGGCHTAVPKLNKTGYEFRQAGYRMPSDIGKDDSPAKLNDFFAFRLQEQWVSKKHEDVVSSKNTTSNQLEFYEATMYPLTGAWGKYFGSLVELSMAPDDVFEVENAYVRFVYGNADRFFSAKVGIMHPWEGFGGSDRPLGNIRPIFQKAAAPGSPFFLWNLDESAIEASCYIAKPGTTIAARFSNGIIWKEDGSGTAEPAQGGGLAKSNKQPGYNSKNVQIFVNQFLREDSGISLYYYHGTNPFPDPNYALTTTTTTDTFNRVAIYANFWPVKEKLDVLGGYERGSDSLDNAAIATSDGKYNGAKVGDSNGFFIEADYHLRPELAVGVRFDKFDPTKKVSHNDQKAIDFTLNGRIWHGLQVIADLNRKTTDQAAGGHNTDTQFLTRMIFIF